MPELPEVETMRRALQPALSAQPVAAIRVHQLDILRRPRTLPAFRNRIVGRRIDRVLRRGKYLAFALDSGDLLQVQVRMTGRFAVLDDGQAPPDEFTHVAAEIDLAHGRRLVYDDVRRLGGFWILREAEWEELDRRVGPEPLDPAFDADALGERLGGLRAPIKNALLDQRRLAGIGNIYASEALHSAGIDPYRPAGSLDGEACLRLREAIVSTLDGALRAAGTTLRDYRAVNGQSGRYQTRLRVYGREGEPCRTCGDPIRRAVQAGRSTYFCSSCQT